jgi:hypothetical protein
LRKLSCTSSKLQRATSDVRNPSTVLFLFCVLLDEGVGAST